MMEDERNQEQDGTFLVEEGVPEKASATMEENRLQEENAVSAVPSGAGEFPEQGAAAKEEYWNSVLTGDVMTIPREVRQKAEAMYPAGTADRERIAACVMQSWVADSGEIPRERIRRDWKSIREEVARQYGASGKSDDELFVAVSMHNQVRLSQRETLFELYQEEYDRTLAGSGTAPDERRKEAVSAWPEEMQAVADQLKSRAVSDALDDRNRLADAAGIIRRGLEGLVASEAPAPEGFSAVQVNRKAVAGVPDVVRALDCLASLEDGDRRKVFRMMAPYLRSRPAFRDALGGALKRGAAEAAENVAHLAVNGAAWALPEGREKEALDRYSRSFEELRNFARMEFAPLRGGKDAPWFREMLVDMAQQGASTALAFSGPAGLGLLMAGETGRHMADARRRVRGDEHPAFLRDDEAGPADAGAGDARVPGHEVRFRECGSGSFRNGSHGGGCREDGGGEQADGADAHGGPGRRGSVDGQGVRRGLGGMEGAADVRGRPVEGGGHDDAVPADRRGKGFPAPFPPCRNLAGGRRTSEGVWHSG